MTPPSDQPIVRTCPSWSLAIESGGGDLSALYRSFRAKDWWYFLPAPVLGAALLGLDWTGPFPVICAAACLAFAYAVNGVHDRSADSRDKNPYAGLSSVPRVAVAAAWAPALLVLLMWATGQVSHWAFVSLAGGWLYSVPPVRLKGRPLFSDLGNLAIFIPLLLLAPGAALGLGDIAWFAWFLVQLEISQTIHCLQDLAEDDVRGDHNTVQFLGARWAIVFIIVLSVLSVPLAFLSGPMVLKALLLAGSVHSMVVAFLLFSSVERRTLRIAHRVGGMVVMSAAFGYLVT